MWSNPDTVYLGNVQDVSPKFADQAQVLLFFPINIKQNNDFGDLKNNKLGEKVTPCRSSIVQINIFVV